MFDDIGSFFGDLFGGSSSSSLDPAFSGFNITGLDANGLMSGDPGFDPNTVGDLSQSANLAPGAGVNDPSSGSSGLGNVASAAAKVGSAALGAFGGSPLARSSGGQFLQRSVDLGEKHRMLIKATEDPYKSKPVQSEDPNQLYQKWYRDMQQFAYKDK